MKHQHGATLIVVLMLLLIITVIGTLAIKNSLVGLSIATNSQAQQLLLQNADSAFFSVEREENLIQGLTSSGMFGYISGAANKDKELVFCYRGNEADFFDINRASIMQWEGSKQTPTTDAMGSDGYCKTASADKNYFTSGRKAVITQVAVKYSSSSDADPFYGMQFGTDDKGVKFERSKPVKVFAVSIMPSLSTADRSKIDTCLSARMNEVTIPDGTTVSVASGTKVEDNPTKSVTECLSGLNVPFTSHATEYVIAQDFT
ncbi:hypothetical protein F941_03055 [Acinetobacter bouvetii DSM 14964 = CIP 107468]|jgi:Tfp pilus assembly protein PilX|uniref:Type 4 fimbrial biogenesis protein PilX N-terminal domain-containing protein n=2 Tax=Acinetobacter bouvetii TaxID=202951 RepID=N9C6N1_9GAMM|nr:MULTISPECIES: PilX N-terminal domain-containing pilus assembly protein [Acinetobacter]MBP8099520.1 pilus assembly protein PilX [Acinetobacter sp.]ENV81497.1 hypothetical protein F941_03055 [Acinetobacter bouvetii DSM 14964 = CIP 107468]RZG69288.1 pilus assembly protein PilX [Acinetobacter bouvetii]TCB75309.1 pilus assembly protein PilX [Acinetobacter sp. ANC 4177]BCU63521.1 type IV fimbrial biogenesis protein [Acinetobacter bouvetii]